VLAVAGVAALVMVPVWSRVTAPEPVDQASVVQVHEGDVPVVRAPVAAPDATAVMPPPVNVLPPPAPAATPTAPALAPAAAASLEDVVSRVIPAVAAIDAGQSRGTGFFIRPDQVLTNAHVVEGQTSVTLQVGSATYTARVASVSAGNDLALLQVYNANPAQPVLRLGSGGRKSWPWDPRSVCCRTP
jgi:hypothetical protein